MKKHTFLLMTLISVMGCKQQCPKTQDTTQLSELPATTIEATIDSLSNRYPDCNKELMMRGVKHAADFWTNKDGKPADFIDFCIANYVSTEEAKQLLANRIEQNLETIIGCYNRITLQLKFPLDVAGQQLCNLDENFGAYDPSAHFSEDMFNNKIAFTILLNFPFYNLQEKNILGENWTRQEWTYARLGDLFASRVPAEINQQYANAISKADNYINNYNIIMGNLRSESNEKLFPDGLALITHWGLRDELKSDYADSVHGLEKQRMIYQVMKHIVYQTIPEEVINDTNYTWSPISNKLTRNGQEVTPHAEPNTRYQTLFDIYKATIAADPYNPTYPTYLERAFDLSMEVSADEIEKMFTQFISAPQVTQVATLIEKRLGRKLEPFDIWYDGFKSRSTINEDQLTAQTRKLYPTAQAYQAGLPTVLKKLGFTPEKAEWICQRIQVDPSRGAGHAWGALMKDDKAHLRTRVSEQGMDYKGYNIATHEFGHNVEQTITLNDVDHYALQGVPNTAFTEALAFVFQVRDLALLGYNENALNQDALLTLDIFWGCYEIMGVSLVDIYSWKWLYEHPDCTVESFKQAVIDNAKQVWNKYYAPILGEQDAPILAIYSHMICNPLYLPNYPYGHLVEFQLEKQFANKNLGDEIQRIYPIGRVTPNCWMRHAVNDEVSTRPLLEATEKAALSLQ